MTSKPWQKLADPDFKTLTGWLCPEGLFYPCNFMSHNDLMDELIDQGYSTHLNECDLGDIGFIKLTGVDLNPFMTFVQKITPRQKITLEKIINKHSLIPRNDFCFCGFTVIQRLDNNSIRFVEERKK